MFNLTTFAYRIDQEKKCSVEEGVAKLELLEGM